jgi:hypothetical protein
MCDSILHIQVAVVAVVVPVEVLAAAVVEETAAFIIKISLTCPLAHCSVICHLFFCVNYNNVCKRVQ